MPSLVRKRTPFTNIQLTQLHDYLGPQLIVPYNAYAIKNIVQIKKDKLCHPATDNYLRRYYEQLSKWVQPKKYGVDFEDKFPAFSKDLSKEEKTKARLAFAAQLCVMSDYANAWQGLPLCSRIHKDFSIMIRHGYRKTRIGLEIYDHGTNRIKTGAKPCNKLFCLACAEHNAKTLDKIWANVATKKGRGHAVSLFVKKHSPYDQADGLTPDLKLRTLKGRPDPKVPIIVRGVQLEMGVVGTVFSKRFFLTPITKRREYLGYRNYGTRNKADAMQLFYPSTTVMAAAHAGSTFSFQSIAETIFSANLRGSSAAVFNKKLDRLSI